ncbi:hypothetical protein [Ferruginibacter sp.]
MALFFLCSLFACNETGKKVNEDLTVAANDTFDFDVAENDIPILPGFLVDTIKQYGKETQFSFSLICPAIVGKDFDRINKVLKDEIKRKAENRYVINSIDETAVGTAKEIFGAMNDNILLQMHKNKNLVSYGFLSLWDDPNSMRPFRKYFAVNYDTVLKHFILFNDYFNILGHADTSLVRSIIYSEVGNPSFDYVSLDNDIIFSFDDKNIYFYFDQFEEPGNPIGLVKRVKRKYLDNFINNDYK